MQCFYEDPSWRTFTKDVSSRVDRNDFSASCVQECANEGYPYAGIHTGMQTTKDSDYKNKVMQGDLYQAASEPCISDLPNKLLPLWLPARPILHASFGHISEHPFQVCMGNPTQLSAKRHVPMSMR